MTAPAWATELVRAVWADQGLAAAGVPAPELTWRRASGRADWPAELVGGEWTYQLPWGSRPVVSSGRYVAAGEAQEHRIVVTAGTSRRDQRLVLLHEIAHAIRATQDGTANRGDHDRAFWLVAWGLYRTERVPLGYALARESRYRRAAVEVARSLGIRGAAKALRERRWAA